MKVPVSWLKDFVDITVPVEEVARLLTFAGLEVEDIQYAGWQMPAENTSGFKMHGLSWDREKIVVAEIYEVKPHPNADRLTLCDLFDGQQQHLVLTGAPNLHPYKGQGKLPKPIKVAYAKEGATLYDGHAAELTLTTLKRATIRGVESYSMVCSERELGISEEHEGVIFLDDDAPVGAPLADYIGDAILEVKINPNMARNPNILGLARELAALTRQPLKKPVFTLSTSGESVTDAAGVEITDAKLNPRFTLGLIRDIQIKPSPYWVQRRLRAAGMRPINNMVDATNYTMLEIGQPLHAFDYDVLAKRAGGRVKLITRAAKDGEKLVTLDGQERNMTPANVLVCDEKGALAMAGVMGGAESEISDNTVDILLEAAAWNFINIRKTANQHNLPSEASYRFSRGVHPGVAELGLKRCLYWMSEWGGGKVAPGMVDNYPLPPKTPMVEIGEADIRRALGIEIPLAEAKSLLERLEFDCQLVTDDRLLVTAPNFRMDIGEGVVGVADIMEELARVYGVDNIPETRLADPLPPQRGNPSLDAENRVRDILASIGLQEVVTHRMNSPENEARVRPDGQPEPDSAYVRLVNAIAPEKRIMRRSLLASVLNVVERNARLRDSLAFFEVGPVFVPAAQGLPGEPRRLALAVTGKRHDSSWDSKSGEKMDFFDLKGVVEALVDALHLDVVYVPGASESFHPGKSASVKLGDATLGVFGELHPQVQAHYDFVTPVLAADFDLEAILAAIPTGYETRAVSEFPPVLEAIALVVDESVPADRVEALIRQTGGKTLGEVRLFDVFRSEQLGAGKKSLAYNLTYQSFEGTLTDKDAAQIRNKIVRRLEQEVGAKLRS
jgi:phenylalanyl-tRNA synthetase beta chain